MLDNYQNKLKFPSYFEFVLDRLLPTIKITMILAIFFLLIFSIVDIRIQPNLYKQIIIIRLIAIAPLALILALNYSKKYQNLIPKLILPFGIFTLIAYMYLHTIVPGKIYYVAIAWIYFLLVMIIIASFYSKFQIVITIIIGTFLTYFILYYFSSGNKEYIERMLIHSIGPFLFTLILAFKVRDNEIENYQFAKTIHIQSLYDYLTQAYNRRGFSVWKERFISEKKEFHHCSVIMLDIDDFKKVNDNYGHQTGDEVIKQTSVIIQQNIAKNSCIVRFGGEEFLIVTPNLDKEGCIIIAENIRKAIADYKFKTKHNETFNITISVGIESQYLKLHSMDKMLSKADARLIKAKNAGKNQVIYH